MIVWNVRRHIDNFLFIYVYRFVCDLVRVILSLYTFFYLIFSLKILEFFEFLQISVYLLYCYPSVLSIPVNYKLQLFII